MQQSGVLKTTTIVTRNGAKVEIYTFYGDGTFAFIAETSASLDNVSYKEGDLVFRIADFPDIDFSLNENGELMATGKYASELEIDGEGNLIRVTA